MSVTVVPIQAEDIYDTGYKRLSRGITNVSIQEVNMLKNSLTLAVSVPIKLFIKFGFVSVNAPGKLTLWTHYVDFVLILIYLSQMK